MKKPPQKISTAARIICALVIAISAVLPALLPSNTYASQITSRSLTLIAGNSTNGGSKPGGVVNHLFTFTLPTAGTYHSVKFQYCTTAADSLAVPACVTPTGLSTTSATLNAQTGLGAGGTWAITNTTNGAPYISNAGAGSTGGPQAVTVQLNSVTNPIDATNFPAGMTFFVRISTYTSSDTTGSATDAGTVTAATNTPIVLTGTMPESLVFCTAKTISLDTNGVPNCAAAIDGAVSFDKLFSPVDTAIAESQMAATTNAGAGYVITVNGATLTSGSNTIAAMSSADVSKKGVSQFGMNLVANTLAASASFPGTTSPFISANVAPAANGTNYKGQPVPTSGYDAADHFKFTTGDSVANSANGGTAGATDEQIFTVSYIVNVPGSQAAGSYTTTLTYICTATF